MLPEDAPFGPEHALWVNGVLAGMYSRAPGTEATRSTAYGTGGSPCLPNPSADAPRRQVVILWASQTGKAEEFATPRRSGSPALVTFSMRTMGGWVAEVC